MTTPLRCAIYTRKSHEEGLNQEFNSLEAQRTAAEHYIASYSQEGWIALPHRYDDGGYSGGTMMRPALQRLLDDIREGRIDCVVVYKIDRLSRCLSDFSKIMDVFEAHKVSFVSITQSFNTSTSMGRLMLNVLFSFAQFEREVTGERIRDKFALSRAKGLWMGGNPPLGYDIRERQLTVNDKEASLIQLIFTTFLELQSLTKLVRFLNQAGYTTKSWTSQGGRVYKGQPFTKNALRHILTNPVYKGCVVHKGQVYEGQHEALVKESLWQAAQNIFKLCPSKRFSALSASTPPALLKGLIYCKPCNSAMVPTYTVKKTKRYHYYVCNAKRRERSSFCPLPSLAAGTVESFVTAQVRQALRAPELVARVCKLAEGALGEATVIGSLQQMDTLWQHLFASEQQRIIRLLVEGVYVQQEGIEVKINSQGLNSLIEEIEGNDLPLEEVA